MIKSIKNNSLSKLLLFLFLNLIFTGIIFLSFQDGKDKLGICDGFNVNHCGFKYPIVVPNALAVVAIAVAVVR